MDEQEAKQECARLAGEHPDRATNRWVPVEGEDGNWSIARIGLAPPLDDSSTETRAEERPPTPDDPRDNFPWLNPPSGGIA